MSSCRSVCRILAVLLFSSTYSSRPHSRIAADSGVPASRGFRQEPASLLPACKRSASLNAAILRLEMQMRNCCRLAQFFAVKLQRQLNTNYLNSCCFYLRRDINNQLINCFFVNVCCFIVLGFTDQLCLKKHYHAIVGRSEFRLTLAFQRFKLA